MKVKFTNFKITHKTPVPLLSIEFFMDPTYFTCQALLLRILNSRSRFLLGMSWSILEQPCNFDDWFRLTLDPLVTLDSTTTYSHKIDVGSLHQMVYFCLELVYFTKGDRPLSKIHQSSPLSPCFSSSSY